MTRTTRHGPRLKVGLVGVNSPGYRSLALGYLRAYAEAQPDLNDVVFATLDVDTSVDAWWIAYRVLQLQPDVAAFSVVCWNARAVFEAARLVKSARPSTLVVVGGPEVGPIAESVLETRAGIDVVVRGEGEVTFAELLRSCLHSGEVADLASVPGVSVRTAEGVVSAPERELIADLDTIPSPYLSGVLEAVDGATYLETYRGCPHRCGYCFEGKGYGRLRMFTEQRVAAEIERVATTPGVRSFSFIDPVFNLTDDRLRWLSSVLSPHAARGVRLHTVEVDIERVDEEQAALLAAAGVGSVETGPQSVGGRALETCRRSFEPDRFAAGVEALRAAGVEVECDLIIGLPGDTIDDVLAGLSFSVALDPGRVQISTLHVLPGTDLWERANELGLTYDSEPAHEVVSTREMGFADLRRLEVFGTAVARIYRARL